MGAFIDMTGERFFQTTVVGRSGHQGAKILWECKCDCGKTFYETRSNLLSGNVKSCGCEKTKRISQMNRTHGESHKTRLYRIWLNMKNRCSNPKYRQYDSYGGRGISVCKEWSEDFTAFRDWALKNGYKDDLTVDRINNDEGYKPENCRWATMKEQCANRRKRRWAKRPKTEV